MLYYIYDGSFYGLLTAIYEIYYRKDKPDCIIPSGMLGFQLFVDQYEVITDETKAMKVYNAIYSKISNQALKNTYHSYLSEHSESGIWIYEYLKLGWQLGSKVDLKLTDERVHRIHNLCHKVRSERHRMLGLVRFQLLKYNIYYAAIEPEHNIVELIAPHFANRMADQNWIIHDAKRNIAALYNQKEWFLTDFNLENKLELEKTEQYYQNLWKQYFENIAISNRINPKLQRSLMPKKYWKHLVEMN
ncbi:MAG: DNA metabolism protein [Syntrophomonadaceae bacterium]|nr:DNA metabolism protein [Syntrophomonadaceae bacterium]